MLQEAENDFIKARNKALFNEIQHFLNPEEASMISLKAVKNLIKTENETYIGMQVVPIDKMSVVITLVLAFIFLHEQFTTKSLIGCILIGAGTLLMVL